MARAATQRGEVETPLGTSEAFAAMLAHVSQVAAIERPLLIVGERGTGKELVASRLAFLSPRWDRPFIKLNCAALPDTLLDSELFGHEAGAFTGAQRRRPGRFELAHGGTLFLDEIATAAMPVQEKLLRIIEYGQFERLGGSETLHVDVRVLGATNADLPALAAAGRFRPDLLDRLAFDVVTVPPLRERAEDILLLAEHFARRMVGELGGRAFAGFAPAARQQLLAHAWPGNVRELRNVVERSIARAERPERPLPRVLLDPFAAAQASQREAPTSHREVTAYASQREAGLPPREPTGQPSLPPANAAPVEPLQPGDFLGQTRRFERRLLGQALAEAQFSQTRAARLLGLNYHQFRHLLRNHDMLPGRDQVPHETDG